LFLPEQTLDKPDHFLPTDEGYSRKAFSCARDVDAHQSERRIPLLMPCQLIPEAHHKDAQ
jgi:hypothetical protein